MSTPKKAAAPRWHDIPAWRDDPDRPGTVFDEGGRAMLIVAVNRPPSERARIARLASRAPALLELLERAYTMAAVDARAAREAAEVGSQNAFDARGAELWADMLRREIELASGEDLPS